MFALLHKDINSHKSGLLHLTDRPYCQKGRSAEVKDGIILKTKFLVTFLVDRYMFHCSHKIKQGSKINKVNL
jgi:hypothetical protein